MSNSAVRRDYGDASILRLEGVRLEGRFEVERRIGWGSYAELFLARNLAPREGETELAVVKALNTSLQGEVDPALEHTLVRNFEMEASILRRLHHPHVVVVFASGAATDLDGRGFRYLVMEHMAGGDAANAYRGKPVSLEAAVRLLAPVCEALTYSHSKNVIHRDVKPKNLLLSADGSVVKVTDYGTARLLDLDDGVITRVGTAVYSAPEHYSQAGATGVKITPAADVYSLGKTAYFFVTGASPAHVKQQQITSLPPGASARPWAGALLRVLRKATCDRPEDRHQSVAEFYSELCDVLEMTQLPGSAARAEEAKHQARARPHKPLRIEVPITRRTTPPRTTKTKVAPPRLADDGGPLSEADKFLALCARAVWAWLRTHAASVLAAVRGVFVWLRQGLESVPTRFVGYSLIVTTAAVVLMFTYALLNPNRQPLAGGGNQTVTGAGGEAITTTDLNVRSTPHNRPDNKVGLAERSSRVRVLSTDETGKWCEVEILRHGRPKEDPASADRGWVYKKHLAFE